MSEDKVWDDGAPPPHFKTLTDKKGDQELVMEGLLLAVLVVSCEQVLIKVCPEALGIAPLSQATPACSPALLPPVVPSSPAVLVVVLCRRCRLSTYISYVLHFPPKPPSHTTLVEQRCYYAG